MSTFDRGRLSSSASAADDRGTRNSLPPFILSPGTVQTRASKSISSHRAPRTLPERRFVRIKNSRARGAIPGHLRSSAMNVPVSCQGRAGWCSTGAILFGSASRFSKCPRHRAGLSPTRYLLTVAQSRMFSIRPRRRTAVSVFVCQIGLRTLTTRGVSTSATGNAPTTGPA